MNNQRSIWMCAIIQHDFPAQMDVFRWIINDKRYRCIWIVHDRDIADDDRVRVLADGTEQEIKAGDIKPEHIHLICKLPKKLTAETFSKRFGAYVNFQVCADPAEYARYFTHDTFDSQGKAEYSPYDVGGDRALYCELTSIRQDDDICGHVQAFLHLVELCGDFNSAISQMCSAGDTPLLRSVLSHAYFYKQLF